MTGWATVALAVLTLATLVTTVVLTRQDRRRADKAAADERQFTDKRLAEERERADAQLEQERDHAERMRRRERQQDSAARLLQRIAGLLPYMTWVRDVERPSKFVREDDPTIVMTREAVRALEFGAVADVAGLGDERAAEQYRTLVHLVLTAADGISGQVTDERLSGDLRRYAVFVQVSLENLVEYGQSFDPGAASAPTMARTPHDKSIWSPSIVPPSWQKAIDREPADPQHRPAE